MQVTTQGLHKKVSTEKEQIHKANDDFWSFTQSCTLCISKDQVRKRSPQKKETGECIAKGRQIFASLLPLRIILARIVLTSSTAWASGK